MSAISNNDPVAVIGAGTMGAGIAQVAATAGHPVTLIDIAEGMADKGKANIENGLAGLVKRGKKNQQDVDMILERITTSNQIEDAGKSALVIEAIVEDLKIKQSLFADLETFCSQNTIIASNTSSISISALSSKCQHPQRIVGMHFFNPAAILKLVEVISGLHTCPEVANSIYDTCLAWGKKPVHAKSTPGFIVNRVARPYYAEGLRSLNEQVASVSTLDSLMRSCGGFKMGPFELTDLIGQDVNSSVTELVYQAFFQDKRFMPSIIQTELVSAGLFGRKTGRGFYDYSTDKPTIDSEPLITTQKQPENAIIVGEIDLADGLEAALSSSPINVDKKTLGKEIAILFGEAILKPSDGLTATELAAQTNEPNIVLFDYAINYETCELVGIAFAEQANQQARLDAVKFFQLLGKEVCVLKDVPGLQVLRTISMLANEAFDAVNQGICDIEGVDTAMQAGVAYPKGPIAWAHEIGLSRIVSILNNIQSSYGEERYRVSPLLARLQHAKT